MTGIMVVMPHAPSTLFSLVCRTNRDLPLQPRHCGHPPGFKDKNNKEEEEEEERYRLPRIAHCVLRKNITGSACLVSVGQRARKAVT